MSRTIAQAVLDAPVAGRNLRSGTLRDQLGPDPTLLVFLRHFGWLFARETVRDLRRAAEANPAYPPILFVYQGTSDDGDAFFARDWPTARAIADPDRQLYSAFGIERGDSEQFFNPSIVACGIRATLKGNFIGRPQGDPRLMPGLFLVAADTILWHHDYRNPGDHPDFATLPHS